MFDGYNAKDILARLRAAISCCVNYLIMMMMIIIIITLQTVNYKNTY